MLVADAERGSRDRCSLLSATDRDATAPRLKGSGRCGGRFHRDRQRVDGEQAVAIVSKHSCRCSSRGGSFDAIAIARSMTFGGSRSGAACVCLTCAPVCTHHPALRVDGCAVRRRPQAALSRRRRRAVVSRIVRIECCAGLGRCCRPGDFECRRPSAKRRPGAAIAARPVHRFPQPRPGSRCC
jgi:hypothetical protein